MDITAVSRLTLNNGIKIPYIGLGTIGLHGKTAQKSVETAWRRVTG